MQRYPFFDDHTHPLDPQKTVLTPEGLAMEFLHGYHDLPGGGVSDDLMHHVRHQGVVYTLVRQLSEFLGCEATLEAVTQARNARVGRDGVAVYARDLYADAGIFASLLDSDLPVGDSRIDLLPGKVLRHVQMDPIFFEVLKTATSYETMKETYLTQIRKAILEHGFASIKCHIGEHFTMDVRYVSDVEAQMALAAARGGDHEAQRTVYYAIFHATMLEAQRLDVPIHIHSGMTGGMWDGKVSDCDPYLIAPFLRDVPHMMNTKILMLHSNFPYLGGAALLAHTFPHMYIDLAWVLPWNSLNLAHCLEEVLMIAPVSKILLGSGQHNIPEIAWLSARTADRTLNFVTGKLIAQEMINEAQADDISRKLMYENACRLYRLPTP